MRYRRLFIFSSMALLLTLDVVAFPAEAPAIGGTCGGATPCECGDTVVSDRTLSGADPVTSSVCPGAALFLLNEVTLDLSGHTLTGRGFGSGVFMLISRCPPPLPPFCSFGNAIRNGTISGFQAAISAGETQDNSISRMRLLNSRSVGLDLVSGSDRNLVEHTLIEGGGLAALIQGNANTLKRMTIRNTNGGIVALTLSQDPDEIGNLVLNNRLEDIRAGSFPGDGIFVSGANNVGARNMVIGSAGDGIVISSDNAESVNNTVNNNLVYFSGGHGLTFEGSGHRIFRDVARSNALDGLLVEATDSTFDRNQSLINGGFGIEDTTQGEGTAGTANTYTLNTCHGANALGKSSPPGLCR